ncbi:MAG: copper homeostasis membrane protein CopD [Hyphomicrobiales bacterium]|nr:copper homeostasis membrane protein CopD [Hyphomicrobiales bacterium]
MEIDVPLVLARWVHFLCLMIVFGASLFPFYALRTAAKPESLCAASNRALRVSAYLALVSAIAWVASSLAIMVGGFDETLDRDALAAFFLQTSFGPIWIVRFAILLTLAVVVSWRPRPALSAFLSGAALASQAWLGHAAMRTGIELASELLAYMVHVLAAGAWIGGLLPLASFLAGRGSRPKDITESECREVLRRFSSIGVAVVSLILLSGIANSVFRLKYASDLFTTPYGLVIVAKASLFALMLIAAAVNRWRLVPRLVDSDKEEATLHALRRNILIEQGLGILVLGLAALLGTMAPRM